MTNPTPRDSAQLPPLPDTVAAFRDKGTFTMPEQFYPADVIDAREALRAQAASVEPVFVVTVTKSGALVEMEPTTAAFSLPSGKYDLYTGAPPAHIPADVGVLDDANPLMALAECAVLLENPRLRGDGVRCEVAAKNARSAMRLLSASSPATAVDADDVADMMSKALSRAWQLGQTYWQQADSESYKQNARADKTQEMFDRLIDETRAALQASRQPQVQQAVAEGAGDWLHLKAYGYAPGGYMSKCFACNQVAYELDKRAIRCRPCAEQMHAALATKEANHG